MSAATIDLPVFDLDRARRRRRADAVIIDFPPRAAAPASPSPSLRLTRRGRLAVTMSVAGVLVTAGLVGASTALAGTSAPDPVVTEQVVVHPGQTLWEIAAVSAAPGADVRDVIIDISDLNGLTTSALSVGQELTVPVP